ncbi:hypothetical protein OOK41_12395 [Micromonospora sp. NBC_01655]|uniref:hypothetical protein n=1 Tax=Micromonospora sp. NBC_01655 TaxID=2975983 RepID=UPI00224C9E32|nr:hypothetical protein [Micromonospora sp. NBC_01655]MCX4471099.1 hypothetical protein [Micromonospora sp. NBC_01655]
MVVLGVIAVASAVGLAAGLLTWAPTAAEPARPLTPAEAERLAAVRVTNHRDVRSGLRITIGTAAARTDVVGWVDWSRPLAYLDVGGPGAGPGRGLLQATPGLLMARPDPTAVPAPAPPPLVPPVDGWRIADRPVDQPLRPALDLIFALAASRTEPAGAFPAGTARWLARAEAGGQPVDVLQAPLPDDAGRRGRQDAPGGGRPATSATPTGPAARTASPGAPRTTGAPRTIRTTGTARTTGAPRAPQATAAPGATRASGATGGTERRSPRGATATSAPRTVSHPPGTAGWPGPAVSLPAAAARPAGTALLDGAARWWIDRDARLHRLEGRLPGGVPVTLELQRANRPMLWPVAALGGRAGLPRALTGPEEDRFARTAARTRAEGGATATLTAPVAPGVTLHGTGWISWTERAAYLSVGARDAPVGQTLRRYDATGVWSAPYAEDSLVAPPLPPPRTGYTWQRDGTGGDDVDALLAVALRAGSTAGTPRPATRIRGDRLADRTVDVIEVDARAGRLRYWIDRAGLLRRLELRTRLGTYAQLDLVPGRVPALPSPVPSAREPRR